MARHHVSRMVPALFHPEIAARNGGLPNAAMLRRIANAYNTVSTRMRKLVFLKWQDFRHMLDAGALARLWPCYFRTGENVDGIDIRVGHSASSTPGGLPTCDLRLYRASDDVLMNPGIEGSMVFPANDGSGATIGPKDISNVTLRVRGLTGNTEYYWECVPDVGMRLAYLMVHETVKQDADTGASAVVCNPAAFITEGPIKALPLQDLNFAAKHLWKHNASHLFSWCPNYDEFNGPSTNSTSYVDLVPNSAAMRIVTLNRGTLHRPNAIPVKIAVKAERIAGGGGTADFRMVDGLGNSVAITGAAINTAARWFTGTGTLSGTQQDWRLQHRVSVGTTTVRTTGFCCYQWES